MGHYIPSDPSVDEIESMALLTAGGAGSGSGPDPKRSRPRPRHRDGRAPLRAAVKLKKKIVRKKSK